MKKFGVCFSLFLLGLVAIPSVAQDSKRIDIVAKQNLAIQSEPSFDSDVMHIFERDNKMVAFGRNDRWQLATDR